MRALQRELLKTRSELVQTKQKATVFNKMVHRAHDKAIVTFLNIIKQKKTLEQENQILLQSLKNFNAVCNKQKMTIRKRVSTIKTLQKASKELHMTGLESIQHRRNPHIIRVADI
tara:strand:- start:490 stop:834 length:345 start_codon:yes stop_codon:yes gene_type:complete